MPYASGENPKAGDVAKKGSGQIGTVFELDLRKDEEAKEEKIRVKSDKGKSIVERVNKFNLIKRVAE